MRHANILTGWTRVFKPNGMNPHLERFVFIAFSKKISYFRHKMYNETSLGRDAIVIDSKDINAFSQALSLGDVDAAFATLTNIQEALDFKIQRSTLGSVSFKKSHVRAFVLTQSWPETFWSLDFKSRTQLMDDWNNQNPQENALKLQEHAEQFLRLLTELIPSDIFSVTSHHPAWRHIRTSASQRKNNILHLISRSCFDLGWLDQMLEHHGQWLKHNSPEGTSPIWQGCLSRGGDEAIKCLTILRKHDYLFFTKDDAHIKAIVLVLAKVGSPEHLLWILKESGCERVPGVERALVSRGKLQGVRSRDILPSILDTLETLWGPLSEDEVISTWKASFSHQTLGTPKKQSPLNPITLRYEDLITEKDGWDPSTLLHILSSCATIGRDDILLAYKDRGFSWTKEQLKEVKEGLTKRSFLTTEQVRFVSLIDKLYLEQIAAGQPKRTERRPCF